MRISTGEPVSLAIVSDYRLMEVYKETEAKSKDNATVEPMTYSSLVLPGIWAATSTITPDFPHNS